MVMAGQVATTSEVTRRPAFEEADLAALVQLARADFWCFVELMFSVLHAGQELIYAPYLELIANRLMQIEKDEVHSLIINMPPRHLKSILTSVLYPAWRLGRDPRSKFICISYRDDLAHDLSTRTRTVIQSERYQKIFPNTVLEKEAANYLRTTKSGGRYSTAVHSHITGFGADEIVIDDPMEPQEALSETAKQKLRDWINSSVLTRFDNPNLGKLILVMHRLAPDDLSHTFEASADVVLKLPLVAEVREVHLRPNGEPLFHRNPGDPLNPDRMGKEAIEKLKAGLPAHVFSAQFQQRPTIGGSGLCSIDRFPRYNCDVRRSYELIMHSWDVGATISGNASVCTKWGLLKNEDERGIVYLLDVLRLRIELPDLLAAIKRQDKRDRPALIMIDERGVGLGIYQFLERDGYRHLARSNETSEPLEREGEPGKRPNMSKIDRFGRAVQYIEEGRVYIPQYAPWLDSFLNEVAGFPNIPDKDQVDSMSQLVGNLDRAIRRARLKKEALYLPDYIYRPIISPLTSAA
jgi:predicted phage terminase large subunit-like protein